MSSVLGLIRAAGWPDATFVEVLATCWRRRLSPTFEGVERSGRIAARTSPNELDDLLKVARPELSYNVGDTPLMEQVDSRYYRLRHILNGGSSHCRTVKKHAESIGHAAIYRPSELPTRLF